MRNNKYQRERMTYFQYGWQQSAGETTSLQDRDGTRQKRGGAYRQEFQQEAMAISKTADASKQAG